MKVLINGLGCPYSGSRFVLQELILNSPEDVDITALLPLNEGNKLFKIKKNTTVIYFRTRIWAKYFRIFYEIYYNLYFIFKKFNLLLNVSNYGLCLTQNQKLYLHNSLIVDLTSKIGFSNGLPNFINRFLLNSFLKKGQEVYVQNDHMKYNLQNYILHFNIESKIKITVVKPLLNMNQKLNYNITKKYKFQLFYPASDFPHKRINLAISAVSKFNSKDVGLVITSKPTLAQGNKNITFINQISFDQVLAYYKVSDALFFTSEQETLGLPLLEAINFELPAILPDLPYAKDIYGDSAIYFIKNNIGSLITSIKTLQENYNIYKNLVIERKKEINSNRVSWLQHWDYFLNK